MRPKPFQTASERASEPARGGEGAKVGPQGAKKLMSANNSSVEAFRTGVCVNILTHN